MAEQENPSQATNGESIRKDQTNSEEEAGDLRERHSRFIECLERNGPNFTGDEWPQLAEDLGWSIEEVQLHAYRYLRCLMEADEFPEEEESSSESRRRASGEPDNDSGKSWSPAECALFDALVGIYVTRNSFGDSTDYERDEFIAANIPGKSAQEVRRRYRQIYGKEL